MAELAAHEMTQLLIAGQAGDASSMRLFMEATYDQLRAMADAQLRRERAGHTLQPTALVHEAFLKLAGGDGEAAFAGRGHFFAAAGSAMRRILVDHARGRNRHKRGGNLVRRVPLADVVDGSQLCDEDFLALDEALVALAEADATAARLVELRFFAGLTAEEAAALLNVNDRTARRQWTYARAYLLRALASAEPGPAPSDEVK